MRFLKFYLILIFLFSFHCTGLGGWHSLGPVVSAEKNQNEIRFNVPPAIVSITVLSQSTIRIRMSKDGIFKDDFSWAVINTNLGEKAYRFDDESNSYVIRTSKLRINILKNPCRIYIYDSFGNLINNDDSLKGMCWSGSDIRVWKKMPRDEYYFGFGEKAGSLEKKWKSFTMWNSDIPAYKADTDPLYKTIPFFYGIRKGVAYGIFFDNTYRTSFSMGKENDNLYSFGAVDGEINYYFIYGPEPINVIEQFSRLVGMTPLPPKWALGYQQSRWSYYPEKRVREIAETFRDKNIPCDVIYLDIHYMDGYRCFTWDTIRFPDPERMINDLNSMGFKIVPIIDPGIKKEKNYFVFEEGILGNHFVRGSDGEYFVGKVWPGDCVFPDFTKTSTRKWWGSLYKDFVKIGIAGFWNDMNEPSVFDSPNKTFPEDVIHDDEGRKSDHRKNHNIYGMQMARATYEGLLELNSNIRPFVLTRANYAGGQRYSAVWTGDNISSWEHLEMAVPMCLNLSISGQNFVGTDIGGFVGSPDAELFSRWLQLGTFTPFMRAHTEYGSKDQEPWSYGFEHESINRKTIELRYRLIPYIYTQFYLASKYGTPIVRPLFFDFTQDEQTYHQENIFMFGNNLLIAPILWANATKRSIRLPVGHWYDYWSGNEYNGANSVEIDAREDRIPIFVKAGSVIPEQSVLQYIGERQIDTLILKIFPGNNLSYLYEDDGLTFDYQNGKYLLRILKLTEDKKHITMRAEKSEGFFTPSWKVISLYIHGLKENPSSIYLGNKKIKWSYDAPGKLVNFSIPYQNDYFEIDLVR